MKKVWGYVRVSTTDQNLERQIHAITEYYPKIKDQDIYQDKKSGKNFDRKAYMELRGKLRAGDTLIIKDTDRLGRNKRMVKEELRFLKQTEVRLKILSIPTTLIDLQENDWVMEMVSSILIEVFTTLDEQDYNSRRLKQQEGIEIAKAKGLYVGRKPKLMVKSRFVSVYTLWKKGEMPLNIAAKLLEITRPTFYKKVKDYEEGKSEKWLK